MDYETDKVITKKSLVSIIGAQKDKSLRGRESLIGLKKQGKEERKYGIITHFKLRPRGKKKTA